MYTHTHTHTHTDTDTDRHTHTNTQAYTHTVLCMKSVLRNDNGEEKVNDLRQVVWDIHHPL